MRQVTGSKPTSQNELVSIRLVSGGHSFSMDILEQRLQSETLRVVVDTHRVTLVPAELFDADKAVEYLSINGLAPTADESVVWSEASDGKVAVMALSRRAKDAIEERFSNATEWCSPLLNNSHSDTECCCIELTPKVCYIRLYNHSGLSVAEALHIANHEEVLYYLTQIFSIEKRDASTPIYISGDCSIAKLLKRYFKRVICE